MTELKPIRRKAKNEDCDRWAYFAADGYIQVRSIAATKTMCRVMIAHREYNLDGSKITWKDYEKAGYTLHKIHFTITIKN